MILEIRGAHAGVLSEPAFRCPDGFVGLEKSEMEVTDRFEVDGDSLMDFEKRIESGCRPFDFAGIPRATSDSLMNVNNVIHYTWIQGRMNKSKRVLLRAVTTRSTRPRKYR